MAWAELICAQLGAGPLQSPPHNPLMSAGGYLAHSLAILTDAAHLLTDFASIMISLFALWVSSRPPTKTMNFGWYRAGNAVAPPWECHQSPLSGPGALGCPEGPGEPWHSPGTMKKARQRRCQPCARSIPRAGCPHCAPALPGSREWCWGWQGSEAAMGDLSTEILGALLSVLSIWVVTGVLVYLGAQRLLSGDYDIEGGVMLITSACAVAVNIV